jgi:hypothetical protein
MVGSSAAATGKSAMTKEKISGNRRQFPRTSRVIGTASNQNQISAWAILSAAPRLS